MNATAKEVKLSVWAPARAGVESTIAGTADTMDQAYAIAAKFDDRRDLRYQDVEIRLGRDGKRVAFAGPSR
jgi:hypothetical protein